ncbi:ligase-associated DNA damage response endonuclease PdeM [Phycisphaerales bacterium AB-hyl4]|uniref:Ligase-associated DNA damage response endonuclease PdeM n=1 Tax=Natronomicrosphaera hydrolytica TaxID=3242702 RepID=A0ABV4U1U8_9BACT
MMMDRIAITWHGHRFELLAQRGAYWHAQRALIVADVHFGKADHFRQAGVPVPWGTAEANLGRLDAMLGATQAARLIVLGDLFHARTGLSDRLLDCLSQWRQRRRAMEIVVVPGNHDATLADDVATLDMHWVEPVWELAGLRFEHEPPSQPSAEGACSTPTLAGHVHPAVRLHGAGRASLRWPCFWFGERVAVLPAMGAFTGMHPVRPRAGDQVVVVHPQGDGVMAV